MQIAKISRNKKQYQLLPNHRPCLVEPMLVDDKIAV